MVKVLVTGSAGFIGMHLCKSLLNDGYDVLGIDNMNKYYSPTLKKDRLSKLNEYKNFNFIEADICDESMMASVFKKFKPRKVVNLAAQAGVRYSLENPKAYVDSNVLGFMNILESCRHYDVEGLIYASSSSVYGGNTKVPFSIYDNVDKPISIYAATKRANELMAHTYAHLYGLNSTGLRFFTVYGPWGRPDMAMYIFAEKILKGKPIFVFNQGKMKRDFTFINDIVEGIKLSIENNYHYELFNLGNNKSENLMDLINLIETCLGKKAQIEYLGMQPGDVKQTFADIEYSIEKLNYNPKTTIDEGVPKFISWFMNYNK